MQLGLKSEDFFAEDNCVLSEKSMLIRKMRDDEQFFVSHLVELAIEYGKHMEGDYFEIIDFVKWVSNRLNVPIDLDKLNG